MIVEAKEIDRFIGSSMLVHEYAEHAIFSLSEDIGYSFPSIYSAILLDSEKIYTNKGLIDLRKNEAQHLIMLKHKWVTVFVSLLKHSDQVDKVVIHHMVIHGVRIKSVHGYLTIPEDKIKFGDFVKRDIKYVLDRETIHKSLRLAINPIDVNKDLVSQVFVDETIDNIKELMMLFFDHIQTTYSIHKTISVYLNELLSKSKEEVILKVDYN